MTESSEPAPPAAPSAPALKRPRPTTPRPATASAASTLSWIAGIAFLAGLLVIAGGLGILQGRAIFPWLLPQLTVALKHDLGSTNDALLASILLTLIGAGLAGLAAWRAVPDRFADRPLPGLIPRQDPLGMGAGIAAAAGAGLLYAHLASQAYTHWDILLFGGGLALAACAVYRLTRLSDPAPTPLRLLDAGLALALAVESAIVGAVDLTRWNFAWIGDEGSFFGFARDIAAGRPWNFFELRGVYEAHPVLDSLYQALGMKLFGPNVIGWRAGELLVLAICTLLVYLLGTLLFGRWAGLMAAVVLSSSHYLLAFSRIGYNNTHMLMYTLLVMLMLALTWRTGQPVFVFGLGAALGACLYTFLGALFIWPITALLLVIVFLRRPTWHVLGTLALATLGFILVITPGLLTTPASHVIQTAINNSTSQVPDMDPGLLMRLSLEQSILIFWDNDLINDHFVAGPLVDALTGLLLIAGLAIAARRLDRRAERLVFIWFVLGLLLEARSNYVPRPQLTRLLFVLPAGALLAGLTIAKLDAVARGNFRLPAAAVRGVILLLLLLIPPLNLYQLLVATPARASANPPTMVMKAIQEHPDRLVVQVGSQPQLTNGDMAIMLRAYPDLLDRYRYVGLADLRAGIGPRRGGSRPIYLVSDAARDLLPAVQSALPASYRLIKDTDPSGRSTTWLFVPPATSPVIVTAPALPAVPVPGLDIRVAALPSGRPPAPRDVLTDSRGDIFVAGSGDGVIRHYDAQGHLLTQWGNTAPGAPLFQTLAGIAIGWDDLLYALDAGRGTIQAFDGAGHPQGAPLQGLGTRAQSISVTPDGNLIVAGTADGHLMRFRLEGSPATGIGQASQCNLSFEGPVDAILSDLGDLFVRDRNGVQMHHLSWWFCLVQDAAFKQDWSLASDPAMGGGRIALDGEDRLYVAVPATHEVTVYNSTGAVLQRWPQPAGATPVGLFVDRHDTLYVADPIAGMVHAYRLRP